MAEAIGSVVTDYRKRKGWSQLEMAHRLGLNESTIRFLEMATKGTTLRTLETVARGFGVSLSALIRSAERRIRK